MTPGVTLRGDEEGQSSEGAGDTVRHLSSLQRAFVQTGDGVDG